MQFSELHQILRKAGDDWFDPILSVDTRLFVDPFLIYADERDGFEGSHDEIINYFNDVFALIARAHGNPAHPLWRRALSLLHFPETDELCIGYAAESTKGAGSGAGFAKVIASALWEAVEAGVQAFTHFEEIGLLREGIGADRISDMTSNILRHRLATYTQSVATRHNVPCRSFRYRHGIYSRKDQRWEPITLTVPQNPLNRRPILLVPERYLRALPSISSDSFWDYCFTNENETLRNDLGADISRRVDKKTIIAFARRHPEARSRFVAQVESEGPQPYDIEKDSLGVVGWYRATGEFCRVHPITVGFSSNTEFQTFILRLIAEYKNYVENNGGWRLLWNDNGMPRHEEASQLLFQGIATHYCKANDIDISKEVNIGRGPVDFKASHGYRCRALIELKLVRNTKFWNGLSRQLPKYQEAEEIQAGYFVTILLDENDHVRLNNVQAQVSEVNRRTGYDISVVLVDASRNPASASKL